MNKYGRVEVELHAFVISAPDRNEGSAWNNIDGISGRH
jgi:hypothetical protein